MMNRAMERRVREHIKFCENEAFGYLYDQDALDHYGYGDSGYAGGQAYRWHHRAEILQEQLDMALRQTGLRRWFFLLAIHDGIDAQQKQDRKDQKKKGV